MKSKNPQNASSPYRSLRSAARQLGLPYRGLCRAAHAGRVPSILIGQRRFVDPNEVVAALKASSAGPAKEHSTDPDGQFNLFDRDLATGDSDE